jgi:hypothetical protein
MLLASQARQLANETNKSYTSEEICKQIETRATDGNYSTHFALSRFNKEDGIKLNKEFGYEVTFHPERDIVSINW